MRFLLLERPRTESDDLEAFDTSSLDLAPEESDHHSLLKILDYIEEHPDHSFGKTFGFWRFMTSEVLPPDPGIIKMALSDEPDGRWLEVFALNDDEAHWTSQHLRDKLVLDDLRANYPLFAVVPLRRGRPFLQVVGGN